MLFRCPGSSGLRALLMKSSSAPANRAFLTGRNGEPQLGDGIIFGR
jgi:hypothetical protein